MEFSFWGVCGGFRLCLTSQPAHPSPPPAPALCLLGHALLPHALCTITTTITVTITVVVIAIAINHHPEQSPCYSQPHTSDAQLLTVHATSGEHSGQSLVTFSSEELREMLAMPEPDQPRLLLGGGGGAAIAPPPEAFRQRVAVLGAVLDSFALEHGLL